MKDLMEVGTPVAAGVVDSHYLRLGAFYTVQVSRWLPVGLAL